MNERRINTDSDLGCGLIVIMFLLLLALGSLGECTVQSVRALAGCH